MPLALGLMSVVFAISEAPQAGHKTPVGQRNWRTTSTWRHQSTSGCLRAWNSPSVRAGGNLTASSAIFLKHRKSVDDDSDLPGTAQTVSRCMSDRYLILRIL